MSTDAPKRVALYARVSTKDKGQNPETQLQPMREQLGRRGFVIAQEYVDIGQSGAKEFRPQLNRLMEHARKRQFDAVMVWKFDRFARSVTHLLKALDEFNALKIDFMSLQESVDTTSPIGKMIFTIFGALGEFERDLIRERVNAGLDRARKEGKRFGRPRVLVDEVSLCEGFEKGDSISALSKRHGVARGTISAVLQKRGFLPSKLPPAKSGSHPMV